jgi:hypothetical protein
LKLTSVASVESVSVVWAAPVTVNVVGEPEVAMPCDNVTPAKVNWAEIVLLE